jgi:uncharacterized protein
MAQPVELEIRNVQFALGDDIPRAWHGGRRSVTLFFNNLSVFFPAGERFFIQAVRAHADFVAEPALKNDVQAFCAQEGIHSREHEAYNSMLVRQGYPIAQMEARVKRILARTQRIASPLRQLAATCALEHFTALLASFVLEDPRTIAGAHPTLAALWRWHAAEENEHKAVAFDVYRAAGGSWLRRCAVMLIASGIFWFKVFEQQLRLMKHDGILCSPREWFGLLGFLLVRPGAMRRLVFPYLRYFSPRFHPWVLDNRALLERWRTEFATEAVYRQPPRARQA